MKPQPTRIEWPQESLAAALALVIAEQDFTPLTKRRVRRKLERLAKRGALGVEGIDSEWMYRLCAAGLMLREYHWVGWEWRSKWAAQLATLPWVYPRWDGRRDRRLLVVAEQGLGDEIVFSSCYPDLAADVDEAWIEVDPRLIPTLARSFPGNLHFIDRFMNTEKRIVPRMDDYPEFRKELGIEAFIMAGNVPKLYRRCRGDFPAERGFLRADPDQVEAWVEWLEESAYAEPWVGWSWKGRQGEIEPVTPGVSLQYGVEEHRGLLAPPVDLKWDTEGVFALIAALGRVVTTTNAVAHMAGALGVPTDVIKPPPIYAKGEGDFNNRVQPWWPERRSDWYPSIRMYRNQAEWRNNREH